MSYGSLRATALFSTRSASGGATSAGGGLSETEAADLAAINNMDFSLDEEGMARGDVTLKVAPVVQVSGSGSSTPTKPGAGASSLEESTSALMEEIDMLVDEPIPIGTLFKTMSPESRKTLMHNRQPLEAFLMRFPDRFSVFKRKGDNTIFVSRFGVAPEEAFHARGVSAGQLMHETGYRSRQTRDIYAILAYIPNEWCPFTQLRITPEDRSRLKPRPKKFFDQYPKYFEVKADHNQQQSFLVRRSLKLQQFTAMQQERQSKEAAALPAARS